MADPNVVMNGASAQVPIAGASYDIESYTHTTNTKIFKYPLDIGADESDTQNFVLFYAKPGGPRNRQTQGSGRNSSLIALHIPPGSLQTNFQGNYETMVGGRVFEEGGVNLATVAGAAGLASLVSANPIVAGIGAVIGSGVSSVAGVMASANKTSNEGWLDKLSQAGYSAATLAVGSLGQTGVLNPITVGAGVAVNPHMALTYQGPGAFREHKFDFDFYPRAYEEAEEISSIVTQFKNRMLPELNDFGFLKSIYFNFPHEFFIEFFIKSEEGHKKFKQMGIKRSVLTDMNLNFDAQQGPAFYDPPDKKSEPMPVHTKMQLTFRETEFILSYKGVSTDNAEINDGWRE